MSDFRYKRGGFTVMFFSSPPASNSAAFPNKKTSKSGIFTTHKFTTTTSKPKFNQSLTMKSIYTSLFALALLPSAFTHPTNCLETYLKPYLKPYLETYLKADATCPSCNPLPGRNKCDITTSCVHISADFGGEDICACRAGYRTADNLDGTSVQWRLPWTAQEGRVFVAPGTVCNTLCDHYELGKDGCTEVKLRNTCAS